ncbi:glycoside hydrolase family 97 protein [Mucilaginibacter aquatilis]|uniref:Glycoside hydrolase family 97 protein n=1 Tax=Mucilaginibacter aquatilis TaxID=1517760 RepID=A0A6I4IGM3_9SPHI|nr:glycoside hydrolase family 97 protein [Mucilaginibacter aquatilis]MVN92696.1 glycoside hydrolase family 97 protein [Mucilaginibacter aquatilis]
MRKLILFFTLLTVFALAVCAQDGANNGVVTSPDKKLVVTVSLNSAKGLQYTAAYNGKTVIENSPLGLVTDVSDFSKDLRFVEQKATAINESYEEKRIKTSKVNYTANEVIFTYQTAKKGKISLVMRVSNDNIAFKYQLAQTGEAARCTIEKELTGFDFPAGTTTFLTPQATPMSGWKRTKPSYEEEYVADEAIGTKSKYGIGYTFPSLFHIGNNWALVSETGVSSLYCASKLSEASKDGLYTVAFPEAGENNGLGSAKPAISLPGETPWRSITIGDNLKPVVESTIAFDVVKPLYKPSINYQFGRSTWSWLLWQDNSINLNDQKTFINLSAQLGYEFTLIDGWWDTTIGYAKIEELVKYAQSKNVGAFLWYNSNGFWNDAPQGPKNKMSTSVERKKEMAWMKSLGVKGIKVDFFGSDKQETMKLYEDILSDANDYGLLVIFHGCTLPRGWERMYPNFVSSEAVLASENLIFTQRANDMEAYNASLHPFIRNSVGSMDFGPLLLNKRHNRNNNSGTTRKTTDIFQLATTVLFQTSVQNFGVTPNNLTECPNFLIDFIKTVPTTWDETVFIDGYPGKYCVLARRNGNRWYVTGVNATKEVKKLKLKLPMLANQNLNLYSDSKERKPQLSKVKAGKAGDLVVEMQPDGGMIITN